MGTHSLPEFIEDVTGKSHLRVEADLGDGFVRLLSSEAERRQARQDIRSTEDIIIEMLRNARDAHAHLVFVATTRAGSKRTITMIDDGDGVPEHLQDAIFEPRVTSKLDTYHMDKWGVHGRGMALYSISANAEEAAVVASAPGKGAALRVVTNTDLLPERVDQSSMPHYAEDAEGRKVMRGPRNINRMVAEFALDERNGCQVFLGSANEILAALVVMGRRALGLRECTFAKDPESYPLCLRPALACDPAELAETASSLGLELSERSARRVLDGEVAPAPPFITLLDPQGAGTRDSEESAKGAPVESTVSDPERTTALLRQPVDPRGLKMDESHLDSFAREVKRAWSELARAYYLEAQVEPQIKVAKDGLRIFIPTVKED